MNSGVSQKTQVIDCHGQQLNVGDWVVNNNNIMQIQRISMFPNEYDEDVITIVDYVYGSTTTGAEAYKPMQTQLIRTGNLPIRKLSDQEITALHLGLEI